MLVPASAVDSANVRALSRALNVGYEAASDRDVCRIYAQRHLVECCFSKLKQFRRVATRFEKTARNYQAVVTLAAIILWMR